MTAYWARRIPPDFLDYVMANRVCFKGDDNAIKGMYGDGTNEYHVTLKFFHCWEHRASEECATNEEALNFWGNPGLEIFVNDFH